MATGLFVKEERQRRECAPIFIIKIGASDTKLAPTWRRRWDSNPRAGNPANAFRVCDGGVRFGVVSVSPVPAESRLKSGFFARKALRDGLFWKWVQIGIFSDFGEKCGKIGEKNRKTAIHRRIELPTDENLFLRCYKWMYSPLTGTAFPR